MNKYFLIIFALSFAIQINVVAQKNLYGIYSNLEAANGEPSGYEMFFLNDGRPGKCDVTVILQIAEGWPQYPEMLDCCSFSADNIEFISKKLGKFIGKIENDTLFGEFVDLKIKLTLKKGMSFWQK